MPRPPLHEFYRQCIANGAASRQSNYEIVRRIRALFGDSDEKAESVTGQKIPVESTVRRYRKKIQESSGTSSAPAEPNEIDEPWRSMREDPDSIPPHICDWIATHILPNDFIMRDRALSYPTFTDHFDAVTRRTAMWISTLFNRLGGEHPQLIWSIAWMYSGDEMLCEKQQKVFDTRPFDYYVALKPWTSAGNRQLYDQAVTEGKTVDLRIGNTNSTMFYVLHLLQIQDINQPTREERRTGKEGEPN